MFVSVWLSFFVIISHLQSINGESDMFPTLLCNMEYPVVLVQEADITQATVWMETNRRFMGNKYNSTCNILYLPVSVCKLALIM